jgi:hypothetical protein
LTKATGIPEKNGNGVVLHSLSHLKRVGFISVRAGDSRFVQKCKNVIRKKEI